jgi:hypothetical protein
MSQPLVHFAIEMLPYNPRALPFGQIPVCKERVVRVVAVRTLEKLSRLADEKQRQFEKDIVEKSIYVRNLGLQDEKVFSFDKLGVSKRCGLTGSVKEIRNGFFSARFLWAVDRNCEAWVKEVAAMGRP